MSQELLGHAESVCRILTCISHPIRLLIVCKLLRKEQYVMEILDALGTTKGNISQHLKVLLSNGLIKKRKSANRIFYSISDGNLEELVKCLKSLYCGNLEI